MKNATEIRNYLDLKNYNTEITREEFEEKFYKTREKITFTFGGWDGKSYDGESRRASVYRSNIPGFEEVKLIKVGKHLCSIDEERQMIEKVTGESHPTAYWIVEVKRA